MSDWTFVGKKSKKRSCHGAKRSNHNTQQTSVKNTKNRLTNAVLLDNSDTNVLSIKSEEFRLKLCKCVTSLEASILYQRVADVVTQLCSPVKRFVVLGVGKILSSEVAFLQFAMAVVIRRLLACSENLVFDPVMSDDDNQLCVQQGFVSISTVTNDIYEAKHCTFFFMPHCPYRLYNHILYTNWDNLHNVVILGNRSTALSITTFLTSFSFESYRCRKIGDIDCTDTMLYLSEYILETSVADGKEVSPLQHYDRAFNDTRFIEFVFMF